MNAAARKYGLDLIREVYQMDGSNLSIARKVGMSEKHVMRIRDGVIAPEATRGLTPGTRPLRKERDSVITPAEIEERKATVMFCRKWISRSTPSFNREVNLSPSPAERS